MTEMKIKKQIIRIILNLLKKRNVKFNLTDRTELRKIIASMPVMYDSKRIMFWVSRKAKAKILSSKIFFGFEKDFFEEFRKEIFFLVNKSRFERIKNRLEKNRQKIFTVNDLRKIDQIFYLTWVRVLKSKNGKIDTGFLSKKLNIDLRYRGVYKLEEVLSEIILQLEIKQPESIDTKWMRENARKQYNFIIKIIRRNGIRDWDLFASWLPLKWQKKFSIKCSRRWNFYLVLTEIKNHLQRENPDKFSETWIEDIDAGLYLHIIRNYRNSYRNEIDWDLIIGNLQVKWQHRWAGKRHTKISEHSLYYFDTAVEDLKAGLASKRIRSFSAVYIKKNFSALYDFFTKRVKTPEGYVDWKLIISCLDKDLREKFVYPKKLAYHTPARLYKNPKELHQAINGRKIKLYTFFSRQDKEDREIRDELCREIIKLAQKGNVSAFEIIFEYLEEITAYWIGAINDFKCLVHCRREVSQLIEKCIFRYQHGEASFMSYLFKTMIFYAKKIQKERLKEIRLDEPSFLFEKITNHERISEGDIID